MVKKYTKEVLDKTVKNCYSFAALARQLGIRPSGSNTTNLHRRCVAEGVDISHFTGQSHQKGKVSSKKLEPVEILVMGKEGDRRQPRHLLHRALQEINTPYNCFECGCLPVWNKKEMQLQIDHINGQYWNNQKENLRYLCPNCHSQTDTWGNKSNVLVPQLVDGQS